MAAADASLISSHAASNSDAAPAFAGLLMGAPIEAVLPPSCPGNAPDGRAAIAKLLLDDELVVREFSVSLVAVHLAMLPLSTPMCQ